MWTAVMGDNPTATRCPVAGLGDQLPVAGDELRGSGPPPAPGADVVDALEKQQDIGLGRLQCPHDPGHALRRPFP